MKRSAQSVLLAGLAALGLAACSSTGTYSQSYNENDITSDIASNFGNYNTPNSTVISVETVPRQALVSPSPTDSAVGGTGSTGSTGAGMADEQSYRVIVQMDDGSTSIITQKAAPNLRRGDRIRVSNGAIVR